eukprot:CAMPEP_0113710054 /NCGR_PEP_ID=MMETSP0038_2-20120614/29933_1 /TAXON_ID=2898 /ORGANISM="Cryptomonas paramecium" /LENGTH=98 /DNA_ID=CAMNT_0000636047 /DNA_START=152 /DNA_END=445 /DNA_ORIENTATION=- /assembly_acc=CAM_ASM_000170
MESGGPTAGQGILEELLEGFNKHEILRIPGLVNSLVNLVNKANVPEDMSLNLEVAPDDAVSLQHQISIIENQYESERRKVDQVCEDVCQRMRATLEGQ